MQVLGAQFAELVEGGLESLHATVSANAQPSAAALMDPLGERQMFSARMLVDLVERTGWLPAPGLHLDLQQATCLVAPPGADLVVSQAGDLVDGVQGGADRPSVSCERHNGRQPGSLSDTMGGPSSGTAAAPHSPGPPEACGQLAAKPAGSWTTWGQCRRPRRYNAAESAVEVSRGRAVWC